MHCINCFPCTLQRTKHLKECPMWSLCWSVKFFAIRRANTFSEIQQVVDVSLPTTQRHVRLPGDASRLQWVCPSSLEHLHDANCHPKWTSLDNRVPACRQHPPVPKIMQHVDTCVCSITRATCISTHWRWMFISVTQAYFTRKNEIILHTSTFTIFTVCLPSLMWHAYVALSWLQDNTDDLDVSVIWWNPRTDCAISLETPCYLIFWTPLYENP